MIDHQTYRQAPRLLPRLAILTILTILGCHRPSALPDLATFIAQEKSLYSQENQELLVRHFFNDRRDGFYFDIGCYDYKETSTTYFLEEHLGWSGIGVDAEGIHRKGWEQYRPRSKFFEFAVTDQSNQTIKFFRAYGLSATELDTESLGVWEDALKIKAAEVEVPTITMDDLLDREGVEKVDFLSMDINGAEIIALEGFDIERFHPDLVHVEAPEHRQEQLLSYFGQHGYRRIDEYLQYDQVNWYFTPKS